MAINLGNINFGLVPQTQGITQATHQLTGMTAVLSRLGAVSVLVNGPLGGIAARMSVLASLVNHGNVAIAGFALGAAGAVAAITKLGFASIDSAKKMQMLNMQFSAVAGGPVMASSSLSFVHDLAIRTGADFVTLAESFGRFQAAAKGTALQGQDTRKVFEQITYAAATLGMSTEDTIGTLRAFEQMLSKGTVQAEELRGQLGDRLYGAFNIAAQAMGVSTAALNKMLKAGDVVAVDFVKKFADQVVQSFGIDTTKAIDTIVASEGRLNTAFFDFSVEADKAIGFSRAYKAGLENLTAVINTLTGNMTTIIPIIGAIGGALLGMVGPQIIAGVGMLAEAITILTLRMIGLNVAMLANPYAALGGLLIRLGLAAAAAFGAFKLLESAVGTNSSAMNNQGQEAINTYIKSQENLKSTIHATTAEYIKQQEVIVQSKQNAFREAANDIVRTTQGLNAAQDLMGMMDDSPLGKIGKGFETARIKAFQDKIAELRKQTDEMAPGLKDSMASLQKLFDIMNKPEADAPGGGGGLDKPLSRAGRAARDAEQAIGDLNAQYANLFKSDSQKQWDEMQRDINKDIQNFADKLNDAGVAAGVASQLTDMYAKSLHRTKEAALLSERAVSLFELAADTIGKGLDSWSQQFVSDLMNGEGALKSLADVTRSVVQDMLQTLLQLTVSNPLKNFLFGQANPVLGGFTAGGGAGGLIGAGLQALGSMFGIAHGGGVVGTSAISSSARFAPPGILTLHSGMRSDEQLVKLQNGERVLARGQTQGGGSTPHVSINIVNQTGSMVDAQQGQAHFDGEKWVQDILLKVIQGGKADGAMQRFNLRPGMLRRPFGAAT